MTTDQPVSSVVPGHRQALLPTALADIRDEFLELSAADRLQLLLEFSDELPELPAWLKARPERLERVEECQAAVRAAAEVEDGPSAGTAVVRLFIDAPREAPTTRGFAGVLVAGLDGVGVAVLLAVPDDVASSLGLAEAVSPLRMHGMAGLVRRLKRQVKEQSAREVT